MALAPWCKSKINYCPKTIYFLFNKRDFSLCFSQIYVTKTLFLAFKRNRIPNTGRNASFQNTTYFVQLLIMFKYSLSKDNIKFCQINLVYIVSYLRLKENFLQKESTVSQS